MQIAKERNERLNRSIDTVLNKYRNASVAGIKSVDPGTHHQRARVIHHIFSQIDAIGYKLMKPENIKQKHVCAWLEWGKNDRGLSESTLKNYSHHLKAFCQWIEKPQLTEILEQWQGNFVDKSSSRKKSASVKSRCFRSLKEVLETDNQNKRHAKKQKAVGYSTSAQRAEFYDRFFGDLIDMGYRLTNVRNLKLKHIRAWVQDAEAKGLSAASLQKYASMINTFTCFIGKENMMGDPRDLMNDSRKFERHYVTMRDKSEKGKSLTWGQVSAMIKVSEPILSAQYAMCQTFGLRFEEAMKLRPNIADKGGYLHVREGTKGGRSRKVEIQTIEQRRALDHLKTFVLSSKGSSIPKNKNYKQWRAHAYYINRKLGFTKKEAGFTPHGLRHGFANDRYKELAGSASPVRGGASISIDPADDRRARLMVSRELGHSRERIASAYVGSNNKPKK